MKNLKNLQCWMKSNGINLFLLNRTDEFLSEYIAPYAERLQWLSNFSGSAGRALVFQNKALIFIDGRYTLQVKEEVNKNIFQIKQLNKYFDYLKKNIRSHFNIAIDSNLHSIYEVNILRKILITKIDTKIIFLESNPIDYLWKNQPSYPNTKIFLHERKFAGESSISKIKKIQFILNNNSIDNYILSSLESIAWLLNIRGNDINFTPVTQSYVIIPKKGKINFFINLNKIDKIEKKISRIVKSFDIKKIKLFISLIDKKKIIGFDKLQTPYYFDKLCKKYKLKVRFLNDPCMYPRAQKNKVEISGAKKANLRDGVSLTKFIYWLKNKKFIQKIDEIKASKYLLNLRKKNLNFYSLSFETISAFGAHAAIPHYQVTNKSNLKFKKNQIYLIDSGAQYKDGTTDITRTIIIGKSSKEQKDRFTRVLKGHIAVASSLFNSKIKGSSIDLLARKSLNEINCDYDHGTGHGIGSFLSVHEGPQKISKKEGILGDGSIKEGMIISNEPGFYKKNEYGIRTENLILTRKINTKIYFETISFAPIDIDLIDMKLLTFKEMIWLDNYHKNVYYKLRSKLNIKEREWLKQVTKPLYINN